MKGIVCCRKTLWKNCVFAEDKLSSDIPAHVDSEQALGWTSILSLKGNITVNSADLDQMTTASLSGALSFSRSLSLSAGLLLRRLKFFDQPVCDGNGHRSGIHSSVCSNGWMSPGLQRARAQLLHCHAAVKQGLVLHQHCPVLL